MKDQNNNKTVAWLDDPNRSRSSFEKRMDILIFAVRTSNDITVRSIFENVLDSTNMTIRACLKDLVKSGYLEQTSIWTYRPTERTKQLFGVKS